MKKEVKREMEGEVRNGNEDRAGWDLFGIFLEILRRTLSPERSLSYSTSFLLSLPRSLDIRNEVELDRLIALCTTRPS